jgi:hypothetical protein
MFTSISASVGNNDNRVLATPENWCISFNDALKFRDVLQVQFKKMGFFPTITIEGAGAAGVAFLPEKWLVDNIRDKEALRQYSFVVQFPGKDAERHLVRALAENWLAKPRNAYEIILGALMGPQDLINFYHDLEPVSLKIDELWK